LFKDVEMNVTTTENAGGGAALIQENGITMAEMTWVRKEGNVIAIEHTRVSDSLRGHGAGLQLFRSIMAMAEQQKLSVVPVCPFAVKMFERYPEYGNLLHKPANR
jgi:hypothetical protein